MISLRNIDRLHFISRAFDQVKNELKHGALTFADLDLFSENLQAIQELSIISRDHLSPEVIQQVITHQQESKQALITTRQLVQSFCDALTNTPGRNSSKIVSPPIASYCTLLLHIYGSVVASEG